MADTKPETKPETRPPKPQSGRNKVVPIQPVGTSDPFSQFSPEAQELFRQALQSLPPNALTQLLKANWKWVLGFIFPLVLTTYQSAKSILEGPAQVAALAQLAEKDREEILHLKGEVNELNTKVDRILWMMQTSGGGTKLSPPSNPNN